MNRGRSPYAGLTKTQIVQILEDMNAREMRYRCLADGAPVILWMVDVGGQSTLFNRRWSAFTGLAESADKSGDAWIEALHPEDREVAVDTSFSALRERRSFEMVYRLRRHDGEYRWMLDSGGPYYGPDGTFLGFVGASIDITERRQAEEKLRKSHEELQQNNRNIELLSTMYDQLQICLNMAEIHAAISHYVPRLFSASTGAVCMINESRSLVEAVVTWGAVAAFEEVFTREDCWALRQGRTHSIAKPGDGLVCAHLSSAPAGGYICVPMIAHGEVLGLLHLEFPAVGLNLTEQSALRAQQLRLAVTTAENLAMALSSFKLREALRVQSVRDPLTQLFNRRYLEESLERELCRVRRKKAQLGVLMIDVDHFKRYNDSFGHQGGDAALQEIGKLLRNATRREDIACRYGGEEFTVVVPDAPAAAVVRRAEDIRRAVADMKIDLREQRLGNITISAGVAVFPEHGASAAELLEAADRALYRAKKEGRNRVCIATEMNRPVESVEASSPASPG